MTITMEQAQSLFASPLHAGRVADGIEVEIDQTLEELEQLVAAVREIRTRVSLGMLDQDARVDIADDMLRLTGSVTDFALAVAA